MYHLSRKSRPLFQCAVNDIKKDNGVFLDGTLSLLVEELRLAKELDELKYMEIIDI